MIFYCKPEVFNRMTVFTDADEFENYTFYIEIESRSELKFDEETLYQIEINTEPKDINDFVLDIGTAELHRKNLYTFQSKNNKYSYIELKVNKEINAFKTYFIHIKKADLETVIQNDSKRIKENYVTT